MTPQDPLAALVREYLTARDALAALDLRVSDIADHDRRALAPWSEVLRALGRSYPDAAPKGLATPLWAPRDRAGLSALDDLYAVVGRLSFEGEDRANLDAFSAALDALDARAGAWRTHLDAMSEVPAEATARAAEMESAEQATGRAQRDELLGRFEPEAASLREISAKMLDAVRAAQRPDLRDPEKAEALYSDYVHKVSGLYARALPYLRAALHELSTVAGVETPPNWPDALPFEPSLPADLAETPSKETPALLSARQSVEALAAQEEALARALDELGVQARRVESDLAARREREKELEREAISAQQIARWAAKLDELDLARQRLAEVNAEGARRTQLIAQLAAEAQRVSAEIAAQQQAATERAQTVAAKEAALEAHRSDEPFFGKDDWRRRGDAMDGELDTLRGELAARQQSLAALTAELARLRAREPVEQAQLATLGRQLDQVRGEEAAAQRDVSAVETALGAGRPPRRVSVAQAEELLQAVSAARAEARAQSERLSGEGRRVQADVDRATVQRRQCATERERAAQTLQAAYRAANAQHDEQLRTLAARRQQAFERHADAVLDGLEESLTQVDRVFIEPARKVLLQRAGMLSEGPASLRELAARLERELPELQRASRAAMDGAHAELARLRAWLEAAPARCRGAWSA